jgi:hemoglobin
MIRTLVDTFYEGVRDDPMLGPIFARHVADWSLHLPKMYDFWSTVVLRTGRYAGRPLDAHQRLPGLTAAHFARWLDLWRHTVARVVPEAARPRSWSRRSAWRRT